MNMILQKHRCQQIACMLTGLFVAMHGSSLVAQTGSIAAQDAAMVQPFITEATTLIVKVDPQRLALPKMPDTLTSLFPGGEEIYGTWAQSVTKGFDHLRAVTEGQVTYATAGIPISRSEWPAYVFMKQTSKDNQQQLIELFATIHETQSSSRHGMTVFMPGHNTDVDKRLHEIVPSSRAELVDAFDAVKDYPVQILLLPPGYIRRTVNELMPTLPRQLGGGPSSLLTEGLVWASLGVDITKPRIELVIQSASNKAAQNLSDHFPSMMLGAYDSATVIKAQLSREQFQALLPLIKPVVDGNRITIRLDDMQSVSEGLRLLANAPATIGEQMRRRKNSDNFKQILLGMHNYHDANKSFPPRDQDRDANGKSGLSWRVHILPYVEQQELYQQFALDEPWDSAHNKPLIKKMPALYASPWVGIEPGHTTFLAPVGEDTVFGGDKAVKFYNIIDGTSNTAILVEVKPSLSVPWTAPQDYVFDPNNPGAGLNAGTDGRFLAANADGSVNMFRSDVAAELLLRLFQKSDKQPFNWHQLR